MANTSRFADELLNVAPSVKRYAVRLAGQDGEDLMQDALVKALSRSDQFAPESNMAAWLRSIVRTTHLDGCKRAWRSSPLDDAHAAQIPTPEDQHARLELSEALAAISKLPERPYMERVMLGFGLDEVGAQTGASLATVKRKIACARKALNERFG